MPEEKTSAPPPEEGKPVNYGDFVKRFDLKNLVKIASIDGIGYWLAYKLVTSKRKFKLYIFVVKEYEKVKRFVDIKGIPAELLPKMLEYAEEVKKKLREVGLEV